ncbi:MAG TPA: MMPL family transporter [Steroidobacteraceae bacterium]|nr:MMPL family transporter [Steroidobacteraceae bacterium]
MSVPASPKVVRFFLRVLRARRFIAGAFLVLTVAGVFGALRVPDDPAIERLIVAGDPVARATSDFDRLFPEGEQALIMLEAPDPLSLGALRTADRLEHELAGIAQVQAHSLLDLYRRTGPPLEISPEEAGHLRTFATGTPLFRRAGLLGDHYLGIALELQVKSPAERDRTLAAIDSLVLPLENSGGPVTQVRRVGSPWLDAWLERQTGAATARFMPLFGIFLMTLVLIIYRSWRALAAMILTLGAVVAIAMGLADLFGWSHTVISTLVPLTVMVTTTATLVYVHSRYIEPDDSPTLLEHHARTLANKFLPCTASMFATAVGFGALAISDIRPVRDMGLWTACGLIVAWIGCFTLFPALQSLLRTPVRAEKVATGKWFAAFVDVLVPASRRYRWPLVGGAVALMLCGAAALFGVPGVYPPLALEMDVLTYVNPGERVAQDTRHFEQFNGLDVVELWLKTPAGHALDPDFLRALEQLTRRLESDPRITAVDGPTSVLRWARYIATGSDQLPASASAWPKLAADLEQIMLTEPGARAYVDVTDLANVRLSIRGRAKLFGPVGAMRTFIERDWAAAQASEPALQSVEGRVVGKGVLGAEITQRLLPTLTESFALTASVIFLAFLLVFRSPSARLMTMIPSLFAILSVFLVMRLAGIPLNIATILIGSTVLGATENDQIHFFYHFHEGQSAGTTAGALRHAMLVAGRPILFATLINASGFLALAMSDLPPMREFGIVASSAFVLALIADFTALPGALWILSRYDRRNAA